MRIEMIIFMVPVLVLSGTIYSTAIDYCRTIDGKLSDSGHNWASLKEGCVEDNFTLIFNLSNLTGGIQANMNLNISDHNAIGFVNLGNGSLATYLYTEENDNIKFHPGLAINFNPLAIYQIEIASAEGDTRVFIKELPDGQTTKVIDYVDMNPLTAEAINFEALENSSANICNITLNCESKSDLESGDQEPGDQEAPNLGVGYFKPPD